MSEATGIAERSASLSERKKIAPGRMDRTLDVLPLNSDLCPPDAPRDRCVEDLFDRMTAAGHRLDGQTKRALRTAAFPREENIRIGLGVVPIERLGFSEGERFADFRLRATGEFALEDCSPRLAVASRFYWADQPTDSAVYVCMNPVHVGGKATIFVLKTTKKGDLAFSSVSIEEMTLRRETLMMFRLPKSG